MEKNVAQMRDRIAHTVAAQSNKTSQSMGQRVILASSARDRVGNTQM